MPKLYFNTLALILLAIFSSAEPSSAYEADTHFLMTYVVCRTTGFSHQESLTIAAADQGMDDSRGTVADGGEAGLPKVEQEWLWHAFDKKGKLGAKGIVKRKEYLFTIALSRKSAQEKLIYLGMYLHYLQDTWAHRRHYTGNPHSLDAYIPYRTPLGHVRDGHQPDRTPYDPISAFLCLEESFKMAGIFLKEGLGREPNAFIAGYQPIVVSVDENWPDRRKGKYFHQLRIVPGSPAQVFLISLIRAQIDTYKTSLDKNPRFLLKHTANKADIDTVRKNLQTVCQPLVPDINIPSEREKKKLGFNKFTSSFFSAAIPKQSKSF